MPNPGGKLDTTKSSTLITVHLVQTHTHTHTHTHTPHTTPHTHPHTHTHTYIYEKRDDDTFSLSLTHCHPCTVCRSLSFHPSLSHSSLSSQPHPSPTFTLPAPLLSLFLPYNFACLRALRSSVFSWRGRSCVAARGRSESLMRSMRSTCRAVGP